MIGNQVWTIENLRTTKYNDETAIPKVTDNTAWENLITSAYCFYNNTTNSDTISKFGAIYNWYAVNTGKLAPAGWHVPTDSEWEVMQSYLVLRGDNYDGTTDTANNKIAMTLAAQTNWQANTGVGCPGKNLTQNNCSGFSALPGGYRNFDGYFSNFGYDSYWWSATVYGALFARNRFLNYNHENFGRYYVLKNCGLSVRLVKDN